MATFNHSRTNIIRLILISVFVIMLLRLFNLQVLSGEYLPDANRNALFPKVKYPGRGIIYDRKGKAILNNAILYDLVVTPKEVKAVDTAALCSIPGISADEFNKRLRDARIRNGGYRPSVFAPLLAAANRMPPHLERLQYKADSIRGYQWFKMTGDSNYIRNYLKPGKPFVPPVLRKKR